MAGGPPSPWVQDGWLGSEEGRPSAQALGAHGKALPGTREDQVQSLGCRTRWPLGLLLLGTRFPLPELSSVCSSWLGNGSEGVCLGLPKAAASDPPLLLGTSLQHLRRKGRGHREQQACIKSTVSFLSSREAFLGLCGPGCL